MEVIGGQVYTGELQPDVQSSVIAYTKVQPQERIGLIKNLLRKLDLENSPTLRAMGLEVVSEAKRVTGSMLASPNLKFKNDMVSKLYYSEAALITSLTGRSERWEVEFQGTYGLNPK